MAVKLGTLLVREGVITPQQLEEALRGQVLYGGRLGTNLVDLGYVSVDAMTDWLGRVTGFPIATAELFRDAPAEILQLISAEMAERFECFPLRRDGRRLHLAMVNPADLAATDALSFKTGLRIVPYVTPEARLYENMEKRYGYKRKVTFARPTPDALRAGVTSGTNPVVRPVPAATSTSPTNPVVHTIPPAATPTSPTQPAAFPVVRPPALTPPNPFARAVDPGATRPELRPVSAAPSVTQSTPIVNAPILPPLGGNAFRPVAGGLPTPVAFPKATVERDAPTPAAGHWMAAPTAPEKRESWTFDSNPAIELSGDPRPLTFDEAVAALQSASQREQIADAVLRFGQSFLDNVLVLLVRDGMALGWKGRGTRTDPAMVDLIMLPLNAPSMFQEVHDTKRSYCGPVADQTLHRHFYKALRRDAPTGAVVVPVLMRDRVVNVVYGDRLTAVPEQSSVDQLSLLTTHIAQAYERIVREGKKKLDVR